MTNQAVDRANKLREKGDAELMALYIKLRDFIETESKEFKKQMVKKADLLAQIEAVLMERLQERGTKSTSSDDASAFIETATFCGVSDWDAALGFVLESEQYQFLNHAINKSAVKEYMDANDGQPPPGVKWSEEESLKIRRK